MFRLSVTQASLLANTIATSVSPQHCSVPQVIAFVKSVLINLALSPHEVDQVMDVMKKRAEDPATDSNKTTEFTRKVMTAGMFSEVDYNAFLRNLNKEPTAHIIDEMKSFGCSIQAKFDPEFNTGDETEWLARKSSYFHSFVDEKIEDLNIRWPTADVVELYECVEIFLCEELYDWEQKQPTALKLDQNFQNRTATLHFITMDHLDIPKVIQGAVPWRFAHEALLKISVYKNPREKMKCICECVQILSDGMEAAKEAIGADALLPCIIFTVLRAAAPNLRSDLEFIQLYRSPPRLQGLEGYVLITMMAAAMFIEDVSAAQLRIEPELFERFVRNKLHQSTTLQNSDNSPTFTRLVKQQFSQLNPRPSKNDVVIVNGPICHKCKGFRGLALLGPCSITDFSALGPCPACRGTGFYSGGPPCPECDAKGGIGVFGPCEVYDTFFTNFCTRCKGLCYLKKEAPAAEHLPNKSRFSLDNPHLSTSTTQTSSDPPNAHTSSTSDTSLHLDLTQPSLNPDPLRSATQGMTLPVAQGEEDSLDSSIQTRERRDSLVRTTETARERVQRHLSAANVVNFLSPRQVEHLNNIKSLRVSEDPERKETDATAHPDMFEMDADEKQNPDDSAAEAESPSASRFENPSLIVQTLLALAVIDQKYDARVRVALRRVARRINVDPLEFVSLEEAIVRSLLAWAHEPSIRAHPETASPLRYLKVLFAAAAGGTALALTGGLAAPLVGGSLSLVGLGSFVSAITASGVSGGAILSIMFGAAGAAASASQMVRKTGGIEQFVFKRIMVAHNGDTRKPVDSKVVENYGGLHVMIAVPGWINDSNKKDDDEMAALGECFSQAVCAHEENYVLLWESSHLRKLASTLASYQKSDLDSSSSLALKVASKVLFSSLVSSTVLQESSMLDGPWAIAKDRAEKAGLILAHELKTGKLGVRPITLVGISMGARVIFYALEELARLSTIDRPHSQQEIKDLHSIIENVVFIGAAVPVDPQRWRTIRSFVAGRMINCYNPNDTTLSVIFRTVNWITDGMSVAAGVQPVPTQTQNTNLSVENVDVSYLAQTHMDYQNPVVLTKILDQIQSVLI